MHFYRGLFFQFFIFSWVSTFGRQIACIFCVLCAVTNTESMHIYALKGHPGGRIHAFFACSVPPANSMYAFLWASRHRPKHHVCIFTCFSLSPHPLQNAQKSTLLSIFMCFAVFLQQNLCIFTLPQRPCSPDACVFTCFSTHPEPSQTHLNW